jgi:hypothetical protein
MENPIIRSIKAKGFKIAEQVSNRKKGDWLKFAIIFVSIVITVIAAYLIWNNFLNPEAVQRREQEERYNEFFQALSEGENRQREDIYGGVTPQETLDKFVAALEDGDLELASKYFSLTIEGKTDPKWLTALQKAEEEGMLNEAIRRMKSSQYTGISKSGYAGFDVLAEDGSVLFAMNLTKNPHSNLWKIESI